MEKALLKKLGHYFNQGLKVGALATAVALGANGCKVNVTPEPDGGYEYDYDEGLETYIFARHRFVKAGDKVTNADATQDRLLWSNQHYASARKYMLQRVADFKDRVYNVEPADNFLQPICDEIFKRTDGFNTVGIDASLQASKSNYGRIMGAIAAKATGPVSNGNYKTIESCFSMLALRAYNDSLGYLKDSERLAFNQDKANIVADLQSKGVASDYRAVENRLNDYLQDVARKTGVSVKTLQDAVNLSILNAGVWGARDLGATAGFQLSGNDAALMSTSRESQISYLTRRELNHNMGSFWVDYTYAEEEQQQNNQELSK